MVFWSNANWSFKVVASYIRPTEDVDSSKHVLQCTYTRLPLCYPLLRLSDHPSNLSSLWHPSLSQGELTENKLWAKKHVFFLTCALLYWFVGFRSILLGICLHFCFVPTQARARGLLLRGLVQDSTIWTEGLDEEMRSMLLLRWSECSFGQTRSAWSEFLSDEQSGRRWTNQAPWAGHIWFPGIAPASCSSVQLVHSEPGLDHHGDHQGRSERRCTTRTSCNSDLWSDYQLSFAWRYGFEEGQRPDFTVHGSAIGCSICWYLVIWISSYPLLIEWDAGLIVYYLLLFRFKKNVGVVILYNGDYCHWCFDIDLNDLSWISGIACELLRRFMIFHKPSRLWLWNIKCMFGFTLVIFSVSFFLGNECLGKKSDNRNSVCLGFKKG